MQELRAGPYAGRTGRETARETDMADPAEPQRQPQRDLGTCGWCEKEATTLLYVVGKKGAKKRTTAPVCDEHERHFVQQGATSERSELEDRGPKNVKRYVIQ